MDRTLPLAALGLLAALAGPAAAHVTLDRAELPADSSLRVALRVTHGCGGAATTGLRVTVPPELRGARPMPHAGFALAIGGSPAGPAAAGPHAGHGTHGAPAGQAGPAGHAGHAGHGDRAAPAAGEIAWTGGRLDDAFYDEFVLLIRTPAEPGALLRFPVVQECEGGVVARWTEDPVAARGAEGQGPAPVARVVARAP
ncbi:DUF1775 domain-containing protein [Roseomonas nepalensis]|uniref:DUF1775 domain-containing protein n=1 Tax=Muricoccus nepalensis TaxID=1854500 RepID=A0A502FSB5_9PROT|nr:YcnI family protein [Roseomonas nepalensis]TPG51903.1 DUF1775 domain-containing protein [Roseomonas nepalensis]